MATEWVPLRQLAYELGVHHSTARRVALEIGKPLGITPIRQQAADGSSGAQRTFNWTRAEANRIIAARRNMGFVIPEKRAAKSKRR